MADERFFRGKKPVSIDEIVNLTGAVLSHDAISCLIKDVATLTESSPGDISFYHNTKYKSQLKETKASACFLHPDYVEHAPEGLILLVTERPYRAYAQVASLFYDEAYVSKGISPQSCISDTARIGQNTTIAPFCVIGDDVDIGDNCVIEAHTVIHNGVILGNDCRIESHVTLSHSLIGNRVHVKTGARIGQKGFGFEMDDRGHISVPQLGRVIVGDRVEVGSNTTIDRGSSADTQIGAGTRIDNLVQIAHNVVLGENCVIVAQAGIAGSTRLGRFVIAAGQVGIAGHLEIGDHVRIAAQSGIMRNVPAGEVVAGSPAVPVRDWHKQTIVLSKLIK